jgi:hypothetical protein
MPALEKYFFQQVNFRDDILLNDINKVISMLVVLIFLILARQQ